MIIEGNIPLGATMAFYNMTMSERFNIKLDNMSAVFILGQTITGHVEMLVNQHEQFTSNSSI